MKLRELVCRQATEHTNLRCGQQQIKLLEPTVLGLAAGYVDHKGPTLLDLVRCGPAAAEPHGVVGVPKHEGTVDPDLKNQSL